MKPISLNTCASLVQHGLGTSSLVSRKIFLLGSHTNRLSRKVIVLQFTNSHPYREGTGSLLRLSGTEDLHGRRTCQILFHLIGM